MREWYCAQTYPNKEFHARDWLNRQGRTNFLPCFLKKYKSHNIRVRLLFHRYIFFVLDDPVEWPSILKPEIIHHVMCCFPHANAEYLMPNPVASKSIEELRIKALSYDEIRRGGKFRAPVQLINEGCHVKVLSGVFRDEPQAQRALVDWSDHDRASLILKVFNREIRVEFYHRDLQLVE